MNLSTPIFYYNTPDPAAGGGAGTAAPGTAPPPGGQGQEAQQNEGFWNLFPNVPQEHRTLLEPHIREVQGHVTKLEEQIAPFRQFADAGLTPQAAEGLIRFSANFERSPLDTWIQMGKMLQTDYAGKGPVVDPDVDIDYLAALARGEDPDADMLAGQQGGVPGQAAPQDPGNGQVPPEWAQYVADLQQQVQALGQALQQDRAQRQDAVSDRLLENQLATMKKAVVDAGWPEDLINDQELYSRLIVHGGNVQSAIKSMVDVRGGLLKGYTDNQQRNQPGDLNMPNGAPPAPPQKPSGRGQDSWGKATRNATSRLARENQAAAQQH